MEQPGLQQEDQPVIELIELTKKYGDLIAVNHLNLKVSRGEIFGLLGPNGAGKSTTILMMLGLTEPASGIAKVCGINATVYPVEVKKKVGYLPDNVGFYEDMTGLENLVYIGQLNRLSKNEAVSKAKELLERVGMTNAANKKTGKYSRGMMQRLGLADVLIKNPEVIILDEPTLGIDPRGVKEFLALIVKLSHEEGLTVLLSSHHLQQVQQICDRVGLFVKGRLIAEGNIQTLSEGLFSKEPFIIEAGIGDSVTMNGRLDALKEALSKIHGVNNVNFDKGILNIHCEGDLSAEIAKAVIESNVGLNSLSKKEYGLEDIYQRYFENEEVM